MSRDVPVPADPYTPGGIHLSETGNLLMIEKGRR